MWYVWTLVLDCVVWHISSVLPIFKIFLNVSSFFSSSHIWCLFVLPLCCCFKYCMPLQCCDLLGLCWKLSLFSQKTLFIMVFFIVLLPHCSVILILSCLVSRRVKKRTGSSRSVWMMLSKSYSRPSRGPRRCPRSRPSSPRGWRHLTRCVLSCFCLFVRVSVIWFNQCQRRKLGCNRWALNISWICQEFWPITLTLA